MLVVAVSSRALFGLEDENLIYESQGQEAFDNFMRENEQRPLLPGVAFRSIQKLLALNAQGERDKVSVILLSSNSLEAGARVMNSARHYGLDINRVFFTSGGDRCALAKAAKVNLFLTTNPVEVLKALEAGIPAGHVIPKSRVNDDQKNDILCIALDGDAVVFSDEAEQVNQAEGLSGFNASEIRQAQVPLGAGPFKPLLMALQDVQQKLLAENRQHLLCLALVTARSMSVYDRVLCTFRAWKVRLDHAYFLDGTPKGPFLEAAEADLFFDDGHHNIESAAQYVPACHVPYGVVGTKRPITAASAA